MMKGWVDHDELLADARLFGGPIIFGDTSFPFFISRKSTKNAFPAHV